MNSFFIINISCLLVGYVVLQQIPSYVPLCKRKEPDLSKCITNSINTLGPYLVKGIPEMNLPPGDPLHFFNATIRSGGNSAVALEAESWNHTAFDLMDFNIKDFSLNLENINLATTIQFPSARIKGHYHLKAKILLFDINTNGFYEINATNVIANVHSDGRRYMKNSKEHIELENFVLDIQIETAKINFSNLINGNEELTEVANNAINENINVVYEELRSIAGQVLGDIVVLYFNSVFRLFPMKELFPDD
ncbi:hypothetical protein RI129_005390 [Pyrocoelia pectoralis]|uniref:Protein takeout n=1 Tax=Pyrocoelia pectoralis TaxID=417401 RepID=A0AAN7ZSB4_9COLE